MAASSVSSDLIARNRKLSPFIRPHPSLGEAMGRQGPPETLYIACLDPRSDPREVFGLQPNELAIIRNVGGRTKSILEEIAAFHSVVRFRNIVVLHHTDCGTTYMDEMRIRANLKEATSLSDEEVERLQLPCQSDVTEGVRDDVDLLRSCSFIDKDLTQSIFGFVFDIKTGVANQVC